jgi:1-acyl-sn-glycerol-3-phosphate acyltransferase
MCSMVSGPSGCEGAVGRADGCPVLGPLVGSMPVRLVGRMGPPPRLVRWLALAPVTWIGAVAAVVLSPVWFAVSLVLDLVDRRTWRNSRLLGLGMVFCSLEAAALPAAFGVWVTKPFRAPDATVAAYQALFRWWLRVITAAIRRCLNLSFTVRFPPPATGSIIAISRHAGPGDALVLMDELANRQGRTIRGLGKGKLLWDPFFDHVAAGAGYLFMRRDDTADVVRRHAALPPDGAFVMFPEGGNFTHRRHHALVAELRAQGRVELAEAAERLDHLLLPRVGGVHAALMGSPEATVVFVAHVGYEDLDSLAGVWRAIPEGRRVVIEGRSVARPEGWQDRAVLAEWLLACWADMDRWIEKHSSG